MAEDPYCYPGTTVLRNKFGIRDQAELTRVEGDVVGTQLRLLLKRGVPGDLSPAWHKRIHRELFGELYPFAGEYRETHIAKIGEAPYASPAYLETNAEQIFRELSKSAVLHEDSPERFRRELARVMGDVHVLHPFREGNTRTLQVAMREIGARAGHRLDWARMDPLILRRAGTAAAYGNYLPYERILETVMPSEARLAFLEEAKSTMHAAQTTALTRPMREQVVSPGDALRGRVIVASDRYVAIATGPESFAVLERSKLSGSVSVGENVKARIGVTEIVVESRAHEGPSRGHRQ
ncbi:MAG TPA: Fic family protein [Candidatus Acidoferrales bacterium]|nr:Fic family protein [Candidatus Acidoferrales bacterium]